MRFLCLHGRGTSAAVFKAQTAALRAKLKGDYQFDFVDGPHPCSAAPGTDVLFGSDGSYCWWPDNTAESIRAAHAWLEDYLAKHGPYDAVLGFSQGCMLASSYLVCRQREQQAKANGEQQQVNRDQQQQPKDDPPFRGAVFVCGGVSLTMLDALGIPVSAEARAVDAKSVAGLESKTARLRELVANPERIPRGFNMWDDTSDLAHTIGEPLPAENNVYGLDFTQFPADTLLDLPTVHVVGSKDPRYPSGIQLAYLCRNRQTYDHGGGHDIPRTSEVSLRIASMIEKLAKDIEKTA